MRDREISTPPQHILFFSTLLFVVLLFSRLHLSGRSLSRRRHRQTGASGFVVFAAIGLVTATVALGSGTRTGAAATGGAARSIEGHITFDGPQPRVRAIRMSADPNCEALHDERVFANDRVIAEDGSLADVFVYVESPPPGSFDAEPPSEPVELRQQGCVYVPRVQGIRVRQNLEVVNDDPTLHNVRSLAELNRPFNLGQPEGGRRTKFFTKPEMPVRFKCDVHPWMFAFLFVMEHPFFDTTNADGRFAIQGLPEGSHTVVAWHEVYGEQRQQVEVGASGSATADFVFTPE